MANVITDPKTKISQDLLEQLKSQVMEQGQVIVHCLFFNLSIWSRIRIWPSTYLYDLHSDHVSRLVHAENITFYPQWMITPLGDYFFTLVFTGLPKSCSVFDLVEECDTENGAFIVKGILRNKTDVYYVEV